MSTRLLLTLTSTAIVLSGCANNPLFRNYSVADLSADTMKPYAELRNVLVKLPAVQDGNDVKSGLISEACFGAVAPSSPLAAECQRQRNETIAALALGSEVACQQHRRSVYGNDAGVNIMLGSATNLFAGWGAVITKTHPYRASVLGALALFSNSERSLVNETVYKTMIVTAVDQKIMQARDAKAQALYGNLNRSFSEYGINQALQDWSSFHSTCSFMTGLQLALSEGTQGVSTQKMLRLQANFNVVSTQYKTAACTTALVAAGDATCKALADQIQNISDSVKALAVQ